MCKIKMYVLIKRHPTRTLFRRNDDKFAAWNRSHLSPSVREGKFRVFLVQNFVRLLRVFFGSNFFFLTVFLRFFSRRVSFLIIEREGKKRPPFAAFDHRKSHLFALFAILRAALSLVNDDSRFFVFEERKQRERERERETRVGKFKNIREGFQLFSNSPR